MGESGAGELPMPRLTDSMEEGVVVSWLKSPGDTVDVGDELVEIETDKATMTYESDLTGTLLETIVEEGEPAAVGAPIARIGDPAAASSPDRSRASGPQAGSGTKGDGRPVPPQSGKRIKASPVARRVAKERGLDLTGIAGSGPGGRIVKADVESALEAGGDAGAPADRNERVQTGKGNIETITPTRSQLTVARRMAEAKASVPHFYLRAEVDMTRCVEARAKLREAAPEGAPTPSFNDMVVKAAALALRSNPRVNGAWRDGRFELYSRVNVGIAVAVADNLLVPTIFDADRKGLSEIAAESQELTRRARDGAIAPPDLADGTFTVSNLGMFGVESFDAVINPPQAAILAVGAIVERPVVRDGEMAVSKMMNLTMACDHRILYGADGAGLLTRIRTLLEEPVALAG